MSSSGSRGSSTKPRNRSPFANLPRKLLREIFSYLVAGPDDFQQGRVIAINRHRARAPFLVAAVCQHWRRSAVTSGLLWHYLAVSCDTPTRATIRYAQTVQRRSDDGPIDVVLEFASEQHVKVISSVSRSQNRWRRFSAVFTPSIVRRVINLFCAPTPLLRLLELSVQEHHKTSSWHIDERNSTTASLIASTDDRFLRFSRDLRAIAFINLPGLSHKIPTRRQQSLVQLDVLQHTLSPTTILSSLALYQQLEWLSLGATSFQGVAASEIVVTLPRLLCLWIHDAADELLSLYPRCLHAQCLEELTLWGGHPMSLRRFFEHLNATTNLVRINIQKCEPFNQADTDSLAKLENLDHVQLHSTPVSKVFLDSLKETSPDGIMWPKLELLELAWSRIGQTAIENSSLVDLASIRSVSGPPNPDRKGEVLWVTCAVVIEGNRSGLPAEQLHEIALLSEQPPDYEP